MKPNWNEAPEQEDGYIFNDGSFTVEGTTDIKFTDERAK